MGYLAYNLGAFETYKYHKSIWMIVTRTLSNQDMHTATGTHSQSTVNDRRSISKSSNLLDISLELFLIELRQMVFQLPLDDSIWRKHFTGRKCLSQDYCAPQCTHNLKIVWTCDSHVKDRKGLTLISCSWCLKWTRQKLVWFRWQKSQQAVGGRSTLRVWDALWFCDSLPRAVRLHSCSTAWRISLLNLR